LLGCMEVERKVSNYYSGGRKLFLEKMSDSVIEIDLHVKEGKLFFRRFFCTFRPCLEGFHEGCRPYLSVDSSALNGRLNGHLPSATSVDGHNWMFPVAFRFFEAESIRVGLGSCSSYGRL
jgi:hypothetical protein